MSKFINIPVAFKRLRLEVGLSQEAMAYKAGLDRTYISMMERGKRSPSFRTIEKISCALGMETSALILALERSST
ncbi:MAG TPA: helix-turn-helix transcriptional regulator [Methylophilaceae bacterium]|jgi:transcriptional regulator with XRE-family HTH domain